jgi:DNA sulfur modification protein DndD
MKLLRAEFQNYRLLRDLKIDFSEDADKHLTVLRAENETGKTTILSALQWALYGDASLPGKGHDYRLHPIDWDVSNGARVPVAVTVDFEISKTRKNHETKRIYRIVRSAFEEIQGSTWHRGASGVKLFHLSGTGADPIHPPDAVINDELPPELREIFFTDGDRALSFIEGDASQATKRSRVQQAIRSLLGLGVLENAIKHVRKSASEINKHARELAGNIDLQTIAHRIAQIEDDLDKYETDYATATESFRSYEERIEALDKVISEILKKGDKESLNRELQKIKNDIKQLDARIQQAIKDHSALFRGKDIACDLLKPIFKIARKKLDSLHDQGKIPNTTIPVLEERLQTNICICGESLDPNDQQGKKRREYIEQSIDSSKKADDERKILTELYYASKELLATASSQESLWIKKYTKVVENRDGLNQLRTEAGKRLKAIEIRIDSIPDADIQALRQTRHNYQELRDKFLRKSSTLEAQIAGLKRDHEDFRQQRDKLLRKQSKGIRILADLEVAQDVLKVLEASYERITTDELAKVSILMNTLFLEMIGADPEQGSIIRRAEITNEFDLKVYGPNERTLNPDRDLNGASRRALTLAFILALTKVSGVDAPNVIDTPLGMMAGYVKRSVLKTAARESSQLILFLTRSEIAGCEDILDEKAGLVFTLTNPAHYPKILINDPHVNERKILRCNCSHNSECALCTRRADAEVQEVTQ